MYKILIISHIWVSILFIVISVWVCVKSLRGLIYRLIYTKTNRRLEILFIILLYISSIQGMILYFFLDPQNKPKMLSYEEALKNSELRFWVIEHFCIMLFALFLSHIGLIFTSKKIPDFHKYKYASFYYGIATFISLAITVAYLLKR